VPCATCCGGSSATSSGSAGTLVTQSSSSAFSRSRSAALSSRSSHSGSASSPRSYTRQPGGSKCWPPGCCCRSGCFCWGLGCRATCFRIRFGFAGGGPGSSSFLLGDDLVLDFRVDAARQHLLRDQLILPVVGPSLDDLVRVRGPDPRQGFELVAAGRVEVEQV